ncbi:hypothetical protein BLM14_26705 (plasmid) [Phyllobacterium zundukense]|uniref:hypothetical protein n=1 Tax=Phyllobacterium zundukense TaxID=1867719 RepID=UPI000C5830D2|nr:hypothetical protein BLM14_26705 [Phyllobacterium zundukense]
MKPVPSVQSTSPSITRGALEETGRSLIGLDPRNFEQLNRAMESVLSGSRYAKDAIDIAAWDIYGKSLWTRGL